MKSNLSPNMEDYLKTVHTLQLEKGAVRIKDIASRMGISMPSVSSAMKNLINQGFVCHPRYDLVKLTTEGVFLAEQLERRFIIIKSFLSDILKIDLEIAEKDTCQIEHRISPETVKQMENFLKLKKI
ncbi:metal-dependent transcriptional regulator [bacterium]|nr:metal-dependent transcriptional regulator [bacterium]